MSDEPHPTDNRREGGQATRQTGGGYGGPAYGRGYGRDFGGGGLNQGFDGSWGQGYGGSVSPTDYREGFGGEAYGGGMSGADYERSFGPRGDDFGADDRTWIDERADKRAQARSGPHAGRGPQGWRRSDERLREEVCERLAEDRLLDARDIEVEVNEGAVTLRGHVPGASDPRLAEMLARETPGVREVVNELQHQPGERPPLSI